MANLDELYARGKVLKSRANQNKIIAVILFVALLVIVQNLKDEQELIWRTILHYFTPFMSLALIYGDTIWRKFFTASGQKISSKDPFWKENLPTSTQQNTIASSELIKLEQERLKLVKTVKNARFIAGVAAAIASLLVWKFSDIFLGATAGVLTYGGIFKGMAWFETDAFCTNFKSRIINIIAQKYSLKYEPAGSLGLENFLRIYNCRVDKCHGEDMLFGRIDNVSIKFSDFYAAKEVQSKYGSHFKTIFRGVLFEADFHKSVKHYVSICHKDSANLATYGSRAIMDDVRFSQYFRVYASDQIAARYALTPILMEQFLRLHLALNAPINALIIGNKIYIAIETWQDGFEPDIDASLLGSSGLARYECEIAWIANIVRDLNLNRKIWGD